MRVYQLWRSSADEAPREPESTVLIAEESAPRLPLPSGVCPRSLNRGLGGLPVDPRLCCPARLASRLLGVLLPDEQRHVHFGSGWADRAWPRTLLDDLRFAWRTGAALAGRLRRRATSSDDRAADRRGEVRFRLGQRRVRDRDNRAEWDRNEGLGERADNRDRRRTGVRAEREKRYDGIGTAQRKRRKLTGPLAGGLLHRSALYTQSWTCLNSFSLPLRATVTMIEPCCSAGPPAPASSRCPSSTSTFTLRLPRFRRR